MSRLLPAVVHLLISIALIRESETQVYLGYANSVLLMMGLGVIATAWLTQGLIRENRLFEERHLAAEVVWYGSSITIALTTPIVYLIYYFFLEKHSIYFFSLFTFYASWIFFIASFHWRIGQNQPGQIIKAEIIRAGMNLCIAAFFIYQSSLSSANILLLGSAVSTIITTLILLPCPSIKMPKKKAYNVTKSLLTKDAKIMIWFFAATALFWADRLSIEQYIEPSELAVYIFISDVVQRAAQFINGAIVVALQPHIAREVQTSNSPSLSAVRNGVVLQLIIIFVSFFLIYLLADKILDALLSAHSDLAYELTLLLFLANTLWQLAQIIQKPLEYGGWLGGVSASACAAVAGVFILVNFLASSLGVYAGAVALALANLFYICVISAALWGWRKRKSGKCSG